MKTKLNFKQSITAGLFAAIISALLNIILFYIFYAVGVFSDNIEIQPGVPLSAIPILISSILPSIIGSVVFFAIEKYSSNGFKIFMVLTIVLVVLSFLNPFLKIPNITLMSGIILNVMHVVVGGMLLYFIKRAY